MAITYVTKNDGTKEPYDVKKILRWELWAAKDLLQYVDWKSAILNVTRDLEEGISTQAIQVRLIAEFNNRKTWYNSIVSGRLYTAYMRKKLYDNVIPTVKQQHDKLVELGLVSKLSYTDEEFAELEKEINHDHDFTYGYLQIAHAIHKYGISHKITNEKYETAQFVFMRVAMGLSENEPDRVNLAKRFYHRLRLNKLTAPTPNFSNLGTDNNGLMSCCLYTTSDTARSLAIGDHIGFTMTYMAAGIGGFINCRSPNDPIRGGSIAHNGKLKYFTASAGAIGANKQGPRGGAGTQYASSFDPEAGVIIQLQNPRTPRAKQNRDLHFAMQLNDFFFEKAFLRENVFTFNTFTAPDLMEAMYSPDTELFRTLYKKYEDDPNFVKNYVSAEDFLIKLGRQYHEVATMYNINLTAVNQHTPFKEPIRQSNLCVEICQPTFPYEHMPDLYSTEDHGRGEVSMCGLAGIIPANNETNEEYEETAYLALLMIDICIHKNYYELPHVGVTAKARMNAAVGMTGVAYDLAKAGLRPNTPDGLKYVHWLAERHSYFLIKASIKLGKERGNAKWMHKTKWPEGWLPIDTYNRNMDKFVDPVYTYDWEELRRALIENKGGRFSALVAHMPAETNSKITGMPNSIYWLRDLYLLKTDGTNAVDFVARESDTLAEAYTMAWTGTVKEQFVYYGVYQKFGDQSISADTYSDRVAEPMLKSTRLLEEAFWQWICGVKTRYYTNTLSTKSIALGSIGGGGCGTGGCSV